MIFNIRMIENIFTNKAFADQEFNCDRNVSVLTIKSLLSTFSIFDHKPSHITALDCRSSVYMIVIIDRSFLKERYRIMRIEDTV